jgi:hypothetical protein
MQTMLLQVKDVDIPQHHIIDFPTVCSFTVRVLGLGLRAPYYRMH